MIRTMRHHKEKKGFLREISPLENRSDRAILPEIRIRVLHGHLRLQLEQKKWRDLFKSYRQDHPFYDSVAYGFFDAYLYECGVWSFVESRRVVEAARVSCILAGIRIVLSTRCR
jgi:hypothetical protein